MSFENLKNNAESIDGRILNQIRQGQPFLILLQSSTNEQQRFFNSLLPNSDKLLEQIDRTGVPELDDELNGQLQELNQATLPEASPKITIRDLLFNTKVQIAGAPGYAPLWSILLGLGQVHLLQQLTLILHEGMLLEAIENSGNVQNPELATHLNKEADPTQIDTLLRVLRNNYACIDLLLETTDGDHFPFDENSSRHSGMISFGEKIKEWEESTTISDGSYGFKFDYIGLDNYVKQRLTELQLKPNLNLVEGNLSSYLNLIPGRDIQEGMIAEIANLIITIEAGRYTVTDSVLEMLDQLCTYIISEVAKPDSLVPMIEKADIFNLIICAEYLIGNGSSDSTSNIYMFCMVINQLADQFSDMNTLLPEVNSLLLKSLAFKQLHHMELGDLTYIYNHIKAHTDVGMIYDSITLDDYLAIKGFTNLLSSIVDMLAIHHKGYDNLDSKDYVELLKLLYYHKPIRQYYPNAVLSLINNNIAKKEEQERTLEMMEYYIVDFEELDVLYSLVIYRRIFDEYLTSAVSSINLFRNKYLDFIKRHPEIVASKELLNHLLSANKSLDRLNSMQ